ncbi:MAG: ATP phosphoribosyltransferase regulatory subunit [Lachnospiraceae bacterium]|nr:ATP phosphoribosyltransferase regulatory subunit [Lachnospiraceae bacterium]
MNYSSKGHELWHTPEGVRDIYGSELELRQKTLEKLRKDLFLFGYDEILVPSIEFFDVFSGEIGTTPSSELYKFFDRDNNTLVLRPDFTPSVARCVAKYYTDVTDPIRICYSGSAFVNRSSLLGLSREVFELGAEFFNDGSAYADAEMIALLVTQLKSAGLERFEISVGNAEYFRGLCEDAGLDKNEELSLRELLSGKNYYAAESFLKDLGFDKKQRDPFMRISSFLQNEEELERVLQETESERCRNALMRLLEVCRILRAYEADSYVSFDLSLLSRYGYYTGIIFKGYTYGVGDAIASGGRYDLLLSHFGKDAPAVGYMIQMDLLLEALSRQPGVQDEAHPGNVTWFTDDDFASKLKEVKERRAAGERTALQWKH